MGTDVPSTHRRLMDDPAHRDIILNPTFNAVGVGVLNNGGSLYVTEDFAQLQQRNYSNDDAANAVQEAITIYATCHGIPTPVRKPSGYSLGVCFAPSARVYWIVMVTY